MVREMELAPTHVVECRETARSQGRRAAKAFEAGDLVRLRRGFYVPTAEWIDAQQIVRFLWAAYAAQRAVPGLVFAGETALVLQGFDTVVAPRTLDVVDGLAGHVGRRDSTFAVPEACRPLADRLRPPPPVRGRAVACPAGGIEVHHGFRTLPTEPALVGALGDARFARALTLADSVQRSRPSTPLFRDDVLAALIEALPYPIRQRRAVTVLSAASAASESPGESISRAIMLAAGFPVPELQVEFAYGPHRVDRVDFYWPELGLVGEFDGMGKYTDPGMLRGRSVEEVLREERERTRRLEARGLRVIRWDWPVIMDPSEFIGLLMAAGLRPGDPLPDVVL